MYMLQNSFTDDGYIVKKNLFSEDEINKLKEFIESSSNKKNESRETRSSSGKLNITLWNHPSDDLFGKFSTNERIVKPMEEYLGDEVYFVSEKEYEINKENQYNTVKYCRGLCNIQGYLIGKISNVLSVLGYYSDYITDEITPVSK